LSWTASIRHRLRRPDAGAPAPATIPSAAPPDARLEALLAARQVQRFEIARWRAVFERGAEPAVLLNRADAVLAANRAARALGAHGEEAPVHVPLDEWLRRAAVPPQPIQRREPLADAQGLELGTLCVFGEPVTEGPSEAAIGEFLSHISHELKSPLNTIRSYSEMLMDGSIDDPETRKEFFNVINEESCRLAKLIENLLDLSKLDSGSLALQRARLRPDALLGELVRAAEPQARARDIVLDAKLAANLPTVFADKDLVAVAISNLLSNAIKYTPAGGRVSVRARGEADALVIEVEDTGIGIPAAEQAHIFEKFYRGASAEVRKQAGTGLGLALAQQIVGLHGGQLTLVSQPGRGTTFRLQFPAGAREQREAFGLPEAM